MPRKHGPPRFPRKRLNPKLYTAVRARGRRAYLQAMDVGMHATQFSALVCKNVVVASPITIERLERIADCVGFPKAQLFLDGGR